MTPICLDQTMINNLTRVLMCFQLRQIARMCDQFQVNESDATISAFYGGKWRLKHTALSVQDDIENL